MFVNSKVNGFLLLLIFGLLCGVIAGALFGLFTFIYWSAVLRSSDILPALFAFSGIGAAFGAVPGILYGLSSYYFKQRSDWILTGGVYGAIPGFVLYFGLGLEWRLLLICAGYGALVGFVNIQFPNWWGMRLRAEGIELLRPES